MNTRKRNRKINNMDIASTQQIESKVSRITETYTDANDIDNSTEEKTDTNAEIMNIEGNYLATQSAEIATDAENSIEFGQNSNSDDQDTNIYTEDDTDSILRAAEVLLSQVTQYEIERERERGLNTNAGDSVNDSEATIILDQIDSTRPTAANTSRYEDASIVEPTPSTSAQADQMAELNNDIDDSVVVIDDPIPRALRPIASNDDDVIFVEESRGFRTIATIDLCDTPDTSFTPELRQSQMPNNPQSNAGSVENSPVQHHKIKCPICMELYGFDKILSTMCGHLFCDPCIKSVIKTRKKCPMCNRALKQNQVHRIFFEQ